MALSDSGVLDYDLFSSIYAISSYILDRRSSNYSFKPSSNLALKIATSLLFLLYKARTGFELSLIIGGFFFFIDNKFLF